MEQCWWRFNIRDTGLRPTPPGSLENPMRSRCGFTLLELIIVISIIVLLAGLLFPALNMLRNRQRTLETVNLMQSTAEAINFHLDKNACLGASSHDDFADDPLKYLVRDELAADREPYLTLQQQHRGDINGRPLPAKEATHLLDSWHMPVRFNPAAGDPANDIPPAEMTLGTRRSTQYVSMYSEAGTPGKPDDDIVFTLDMRDGEKKAWIQSRGRKW